MANLYMGLEPFKLTDINTIESIEFDTFDDMMKAATKTSSTIYIYDLYKAEKAIANYFNRNKYTALNTHELDNVNAELKSKQFYSVGSSVERTCVMIKARRTAKIQSMFLGLSNLFGKFTEAEVASAALGEKATTEEDTIMGICMAIENLQAQGHTAWTLAGNALKDLKQTCFANKDGKYAAANFKEWFPTLEEEVHNYVISSFQNGICHFNTAFVGSTDVEGTEYDVNSMYPSVMLDEFLPYGAPVFFEGKLDKPVVNGKPVLHFQRVQIAKMTVMKDGVACIRNKEEENYYTVAENVELVLNHVDLEMLFDNYDVEGLEYIDGYKFRGRIGMFDKYINKWADQKKNAEDDSFERMYAKLMLNSAFGKFASRTNRRASEWVEIKFGSQKGNIVKQRCRDKSKVEGTSVYAPVGCYITSYARQRLLDAIKANKENFIYSDTDSIYVKGKATNILIDENKTGDLGLWKEEFTFSKMNIIGKKQYCVQKTDGTIKIALAGCPDNVVKEMTQYEDFFVGKEIEYKVKNFDLEGKAYYETCKYVLKNEDIQ